uniref:Uncharacterized protein n=1 Tax=Vespula pensylvanica TaxID=30213 RepID=A0A834KSC6_VESPE|nr:hypothetical protein H0235_014113 [Vespula pensylvanica]
MPVGIPGAFISRRDSFLETPLSRTDDADIGPSRKRGRDNAAAPNSHLTPRDSSTREPGIPDGLCFFENLRVRSPSKRDRTSLEGYGRPARSTKRPTLSEGSTTSSRTPTDRDTWKQKHRWRCTRCCPSMCKERTTLKPEAIYDGHCFLEEFEDREKRFNRIRAWEEVQETRHSGMSVCKGKDPRNEAYDDIGAC